MVIYADCPCCTYIHLDWFNYAIHECLKFVSRMFIPRCKELIIEVDRSVRRDEIIHVHLKKEPFKYFTHVLILTEQLDYFTPCFVFILPCSNVNNELISNIILVPTVRESSTHVVYHS